VPGVLGRARLAAALDDANDLLGQAVAVLRAAAPEPDPALLATGLADRLLLAMHEQALGRPLEHTVACPACGALTTLLLSRAEVGEHYPRSAWCGPGVGAHEPTYADLMSAQGDPEALLTLCRVGQGATLDDLARIEGSLCGPLRSSCCECAAPLEVDVDVVTLVLRALSTVRTDIDQEVHLLAAGYGWDLTTIESLPDERRRRLAALVAATAP
jgi:hypothetical protein